MSLEVHQIPMFADNYAYFIVDSKRQHCTVVDPGDAHAVLEFLQQKKWTLQQIWLTHHHLDHSGGALSLKYRTGAKIYGPVYDNKRISHVDYWLKDNDSVTFAEQNFQVLHLPGHTLGHIAYYSQATKALFCGDVLFSLGCGRLFEGSPLQMWRSLQRIKQLPEDTLVYCAHEYTETNARFALHIDPNNKDLQNRNIEVQALRREQQSTVPTTLATELATNPFLRTSDSEIADNLKMQGRKEHEIFAKLRSLKDNF